MKRAHFRNLQRSIAEVLKEAQLAYQFSPNSYTCSALIACLQADKMLRAATATSSSSPKTAGCDTAQRLKANRCLRPEDQPRLSKVSIPTRWDKRRDRRRRRSPETTVIKKCGQRCAHCDPRPQMPGNPRSGEHGGASGQRDDNPPLMRRESAEKCSRDEGAGTTHS